MRGTLLAAGWYVAKGWSTGERTETTVALTSEALALRPSPPYDLLGADWLARWNRSGAKIPTWVRVDERAVFEAAILSHRQFEGWRRLDKGKDSDSTAGSSVTVSSPINMGLKSITTFP